MGREKSILLYVGVAADVSEIEERLRAPIQSVCVM